MFNFSEAFKRLFQRPDFAEEFRKFINQKCKATIIRYNAKSEDYIDIRDVFKVTEAQQFEMYAYFQNVVKGILSNEDKVLAIAKHITNKMKYVGDPTRYGKPEYWADPYTIFKSWKDDCDGYAVLTCYAWGLVGIPAARRYVAHLDVFYPNGTFAGGHAPAIYWSETTNELYAIEGSFYPQLSWAEFNKIPLRSNERYGQARFYTNEQDSYFDIVQFWR